MEQQELEKLHRLAEQNDAEALKNLGNYYGDQQHDYKKAIEYYKRSASLGNEKAMYNIGLRFEYGQGVAIDADEAIEWYQKSANKGFKKANLRIDAIGFNLECGINGFSMDKGKAAQVYKIAAENGCSVGQYHFGTCLLTGTGIEKNESAAFNWLKEATENKDEKCVLAYGNLGYCYEFGAGTDVDLGKAAYCYLKSRMNNLSDNWASTRFNATLKYLENKNLSKEEIIFVASSVTYITNCSPESVNDTLKWIIPAAEMGDPTAMDQLGMAYEKGIGFEINADKAEEYLCKAAELGNTLAINYLALWFYGIGTTKNKNTTKSAFWFERLYELNQDKGAARKLFYYYLKGDGVQKNLATAFKWGEKANFDVGFRHDGELSFFGDCYEQGIGTEVDHLKAMSFYEQALIAEESYSISIKKEEIEKKLEFVKKEILAEGGDVEIQKELAHVTRENNPKQADYWTLKAAQNGDGESCYYLAYELFFEEDKDVEALEYCKKAAEKGHKKAQVLLPIIQNFVIASQGDATAQCYVGMYYEEGNEFIKQNLEKAESWYKKAMLNGNQNAAVLLSGVQMKLNNKESEAQREAMERMKREMESMREESERNRDAAEKSLAEARKSREDAENSHRQELEKIREEAEKVRRDREAAEREREDAANDLRQAQQERDAMVKNTISEKESKTLIVRINYTLICLGASEPWKRHYTAEMSEDLYNKLSLASEYEIKCFLKNRGEDIRSNDSFYVDEIEIE